MSKTLLRLKFAASQPVWIEVVVTEAQKREVFQTCTYGYFPVAYIWPVGSSIMFDCDTRQWLTVDGGSVLSRIFREVAMAMTAEDRKQVQQLVTACTKTKLDLGEDE